MKEAQNTPITWSEDRLQAEFYRWFHNKYPSLRGLLFAVPNGGLRGGLQGKVLKATGLVPGVADMLFCYAGKTYFLELKRPDGKGSQSDNQRKFEAVVRKQGFHYRLYNDLKTLQVTIMAIVKVEEDISNQLKML